MSTEASRDTTAGTPERGTDAECQHVLEFQNDDIEHEQERVARSFGFSLVRHRLELYGLCPRARGIKGGWCPNEEQRKLSD